MKESTDSQDRILLPGREELYKSIAMQGIQNIPMQNEDRRKHLKSLIMTLLKTMAFGSNMFVEDHRFATDLWRGEFWIWIQNPTKRQ